MDNPFNLIDQRLDRIESLVLELKSKSSQPPTPYTKDLMSINEAVVLLELAKSTVYNLVSSGKLPVMKKSKRLYFSRKELLHWIETGRKKTMLEIEEEARSYAANRQLSSPRK